MLFTFIAGLVAFQSVALRPDTGRARRSQSIAKLGELVNGLSDAADGMPILQSASGIVGDILAQNGTEHLSDADEDLLRRVVTMLNTTFYASMTTAHDAQQKQLDNAVAAVKKLNSDIKHEQSSDGELGKLEKRARDKQKLLNAQQKVVDDAIAENESQWRTFDTYMRVTISDPPKYSDTTYCRDFPKKNERTMGGLDVYFEDEKYVEWFETQQDGYAVAKKKWSDANAELLAALEAYNIDRALRDVQYCDWKEELEDACSKFDEDYSTQSSQYNDELVVDARQAMGKRIDLYEAAETIIYQIEFLLGLESSQDNPNPIDTSVYTLSIVDLPAKGDCDLDVLDESQTWVPMVECEVAYDDCPELSPDMGGHPTMCGEHLPWDKSIKFRRDATKRCLPGYASTRKDGSKDSCKVWCEDRQFKCLRGQDNQNGRCGLDSRHSRQTEAENGCLQEWSDQVCECGQTTPHLTGPSYETLDIMDFDGNTRITLPASGRSEGNKARSISVWLKNGRGGNANERLGWTIFGQGVKQNGKMWVVCARGDLHGMGIWGEYRDIWLDTGNTKWEQDEWHHLAVTWNGADLVIYYDGEVLGEAGPDTAWNRHTSTFDTDGSVAYFGGGVQQKGGNPHMKYFKGQAAGLRIWNDEVIDQRAVKFWMDAEKEHLTDGSLHVEVR